MEEVLKKRTLKGPYTSEEITAILGASWVPMPRFAIDQNGTLWAVDNGRRGGLWKLTLGGVDEIAAVSVAWLEAIRPDRSVVIVLSDGSVLRGVLHFPWYVKKAMDLVGRLGDVKSAYRQLAGFPGRAFAAVAVAWDSEVEAPAYFIPRALLFGEAAAVYGINEFLVSSL